MHNQTVNQDPLLKTLHKLKSTSTFRLPLLKITTRNPHSQIPSVQAGATKLNRRVLEQLKSEQVFVYNDERQSESPYQEIHRLITSPEQNHQRQTDYEITQAYQSPLKQVTPEKVKYSKEEKAILQRADELLSLAQQQQQKSPQRSYQVEAEQNPYQMNDQMSFKQNTSPIILSPQQNSINQRSRSVNRNYFQPQQRYLNKRNGSQRDQYFEIQNLLQGQKSSSLKQIRDHEGYSYQENHHYDIENIPNNHPVFSKISTMASQILERESENKEYFKDQTIYKEDEVDDRLIFILQGQVSLNKRHFGKFASLNTIHTLGEDGILDRRISNRKRETAQGESTEVVTLEIKRADFLKVKNILYQMNLKKDYLTLEAFMRRSLFAKRNFTYR